MLECLIWVLNADVGDSPFQLVCITVRSHVPEAFQNLTVCHLLTMLLEDFWPTTTPWIIFCSIWGFPKIVVSPKWMVYNRKPYEQMDDLGVSLFLETPIYLHFVCVSLELSLGVRGWKRPGDVHYCKVPGVNWTRSNVMFILESIWVFP